ncbi:hypothetical protein SAMD00019534_029090 [Acytostelium subglobosum LB1]|uniref:hypothetical protein n=1 Tax=Acytostelium subglobosum LB1 TaxID=1410327 RepID=UPI00064511BF|nr:hypothetical protein SAMD00019534_029090 [Acytostelium subglobosum LB1]GAM19734.1 hypothetical protein SAMD00019534_029090 [Acytostelium subglobosum LB1]|eukprot:XP_012756496.1 hypothetical protein SAMD00019534_029090 [Acytostelium subglobosum LB1]
MSEDVDFDELQKMLADLASSCAVMPEPEPNTGSSFMAPPKRPPPNPPARNSITSTTSTTTTSPLITASTTSGGQSTLNNSSSNNLKNAIGNMGMSAGTLTSTPSTPSMSSMSPSLVSEISLEEMRQIHENSPLTKVKKPYTHGSNPIPRLMIQEDEAPGDTGDDSSSSSYSSDSESESESGEMRLHTNENYQAEQEQAQAAPTLVVTKPRMSAVAMSKELDMQMRGAGVNLSSVIDTSFGGPSSRLPTRPGSMRISISREINEDEYTLQQAYETQRKISMSQSSSAHDALAHLPHSHSQPNSLSAAGTTTPTITTTTTSTSMPTTAHHSKQLSANELRSEVLTQLEGTSIRGTISESTRDLMDVVRDGNIQVLTASSYQVPIIPQQQPQLLAIPGTTQTRPRNESIADRWDIGRPRADTTTTRRSQSMNIQRVGDEFNVFRANPLKKPNPELDKLLIHISLVDQSHKVICITEDFFVIDIINLFAEKMGLVQTEYFSLCEPSADGHSDRWLDPTKLTKESGIRNLSKLVFKIKYFKQPKKLTDPKAVHLYYLQIQQAVITGVYPCSEAMAFRLAALQFYITFGAHDREQHVAGFLEHETLLEFVPQRHFHSHSDEYIQRRLFLLHSQIKCNSSIEAKLRYLDLSNKIPTFGVTAFKVYDGTQTPRAEKTLCVAEDGILISKKDGNGHDLFGYRDITNWELTTRGIKIYLPSPKQLITTPQTLNGNVNSLHFETVSTEQANNIMELLSGYNNFIQYDDSLRGLCPHPNVDFSVSYQFPLYQPPKARTKTDPLRSRVELFKSIYLRLPYIQLIDQIDAVLDKEGSFRNGLNYDTLDLSQLNARASDLSLIADALRDACNTPIEQGETIVENLSIHTVDISNNPLMGTDISEPFKIIIQASKGIKCLNIRNIGITQKGLAPITSIFEKISTLDSIQMGKNRLMKPGVKQILKSLSKSTKLRSIGFEETGIQDEGARFIQKLLTNYTSLTALNVSKNRISDNGFKLILKGLEANNLMIQDLNISGNPIQHKQINTFLKWIASSNCNLTTLCIGSTSLNSSSGTELYKVLCSNGCKLTHLDVSLNHLGDSGTKNVIKGAISNLTIRELFLAGNSVGFSACNTLCQSLESTSQLTKLSLRYCSLNSKSLKRVIKMLETNTTLTSLDLSMNKFSKSVCQSLSQSLPTIKHLEELFLKSCEIGASELKKLVPGLEMNTSLKRIFLDENPFGKKGLLPLVSMININKTIEVIALRNINLTAKPLLEFLKALNTKASIQKLNLCENPVQEKTSAPVKAAIDEQVKRLTRINIQFQ